MASGSFRVKTEGFKSLEKRLEGMSADVVQQVSDKIDEHILAINVDQKAATVVDNGTLKRGNQFDVSQQKYKEIYNNTNYAAYVEFGTGGLAEVPSELSEYAEQFNKHQDKINLPARPFFFAPFFKRRTKILRDVLTIIGKFGK